jgi:capsular polysaccharide biosynthesis protein
MTIGLKNALGRIPMAADLYDAVRGGRPRTRYNLEQLAAHLPAAVEQTRPFAAEAKPRSKLLLFATLHYWIEQAAMVGLALRGKGYDVTIGYLPYASLDKEINSFDLRRQDLYTRRVLQPLNGLIKVVSLLDVPQAKKLPDALANTAETAAAFDTMYSLQVEDFDRESTLYRLRTQRNHFALLSALNLLASECPQAVLIPNGLVTELGVVYQAAQHLGLNTVTYEFNDQREQVWLSQNDIVMHQNTDALWATRGAQPLSDPQRQAIAELEDARSRARKYGKGTRFWQDVASVGGEQLRETLNLDKRPVIVLATNVLGDSLTLGRHIFAASMAEWIEKTVQYFAKRPDVQLVVRVHPGERLMKGPSIIGVIERALPVRPEHVHIIGPSEKINTYDLMEIASLGLAYTTTVGMEMSMRGVPVIVAGNTHYRGRGFTYDPSTWDEYFGLLKKILDDLPAHRLSLEQVETAWNYAYRFFFEFPLDFPWRLMHFWSDVEIWPLKRVLSGDGEMQFGRTFSYLAGEPLRW